MDRVGWKTDARSGCRKLLHLSELIQVQNHQFTVVSANLKPVQPEPIILRVREPGPGLGLTEPNHLTLDGVLPGLVVGVGDLVGDPNASAGREGWKLFAH